jgi:hypothetical protein
MTIFFILSCAHHISERQFKTENPAFELLVISDQSEYKSDIRRRIINRYKNRGNITVMGVKHLGRVECDLYDAILVMDTCKAWMWFDLSLKSFLKRTRHCNNIVLYLTAGDPEWTYQYGGLDAITSASDAGKKDAVLNRLTTRIDPLISAH